MMKRWLFGMILGAMCSLMGCEAAPEGEASKGMYDDEFQVQAPADESGGPAFGETDEPETASGASESTTNGTDNEAPAPTPGDDTPNTTPAPTGEDTDAADTPENKYCGDGVCGEGEPDSCWIDCSPPPENTPVDNPNNSNTDDDDADATPAPPASNNPPGDDGAGPWGCVQTQCAFEWDMCMSDPSCATLHQCMLGCPGNESCKDQCLASAGPLASLKLDDVALCAAVMGCI